MMNFQHKYKIYKKSAAERNLEFMLSFEEFETLMKAECHYCGVSPANGIDRYKNDKGYISTNSVPSCTQCNRAKFTYSPEMFRVWAKRLVQHEEQAQKLHVNLETQYTYDELLSQFKKHIILTAFERCNGSIYNLRRVLNLSSRQLRYICKTLKIDLKNLKKNENLDMK